MLNFSNLIANFMHRKSQKRSIVFLYSEKHAQTGSTFMRGKQLSEVIASHYEGDRNVRYRKNADGLRNCLIFATKGFLKSTDVEALRKIRKRNIIVADFVDEPPISEISAEIDAFVASSYKSLEYSRRHFPQVPTFHITHHVDLRIPKKISLPTDKLRTGYFGELVNTIQFHQLENLIDFHSVSTKTQNPNWIKELKNYNLHYAVRNDREIDGAKPFLKGFTAARCGARILVPALEGDASQYLGAEYPYLINGDITKDSILSALEFATGTFDGPEWRLAGDIMSDVRNRSSLQYITKEFDNMIKELER